MEDELRNRKTREHRGALLAIALGFLLWVVILVVIVSVHSCIN